MIDDDGGGGGGACVTETNIVLYTCQLPGVLRRLFSASWNIMPTSMLR